MLYSLIDLKNNMDKRLIHLTQSLFPFDFSLLSHTVSIMINFSNTDTKSLVKLEDMINMIFSAMYSDFQKH